MTDFKCPLCGQKTQENIIDPKRTHEAILAHDGLHETIRELRAQRDELATVLRLLVVHDISQDEREKLPHCIELEGAIDLLKKYRK